MVRYLLLCTEDVKREEKIVFTKGEKYILIYEGSMIFGLTMEGDNGKEWKMDQLTIEKNFKVITREGG